MYLSLLVLSLLFVSKAFSEVEKDEDFEEEDETEFALVSSQSCKSVLISQLWKHGGVPSV